MSKKGNPFVLSSNCREKISEFLGEFFDFENVDEKALSDDMIRDCFYTLVSEKVFFNYEEIRKTILKDYNLIVPVWLFDVE